MPPPRRRGPYKHRKPAEPATMNVSGPSLDTSSTYAIAVQKLSQDQQKREGEQAVELIEGAAPPVGPNGEGTHVNTYA